jgi:hypothetical protein
MGLKIDGESAVKEISRYATEGLALEAKAKLSLEERGRTLIRSVSPKKA